MSRLDASRRADRSVPATIDVDLAWHLVARAMRWMNALGTRLIAERKRARAVMVRTERQTGPDAAAGRPVRIPRRGAPGAFRLRRETCIDGRPAAEVVGQICADLTAAATLLHSPSLARRIAEIAAAARALLGGPADSWTPLPMIRRRCHVAAETLAAATAALLAAVAPVPAPDTG